MVALPCGAIAGLAYWIVAIKLDKRLRRRLIMAGAALMVTAAAVLVAHSR